MHKTHYYATLYSLTNALAAMKTQRSYRRKVLLTMHWKGDDVNAAAHAFKMANLTRDVFGFELEKYHELSVKRSPDE